MTYPRVIGLNGVARAGKDTVAGILHDLYGYEILSFSDILNQALVALDPWVPLTPEDVASFEFAFPETGQAYHVRYSDVVQIVGYERAKEIREVRRLLQAMGTEVGRNILGANIWVDALFANLSPEKQYVITNVRFPNEYQKVRGHNGALWLVRRPGYRPALDHISDTALEGYAFDVTIDNDGDIRELADKVMRIMDPVQAVYA